MDRDSQGETKMDEEAFSFFIFEGVFFFCLLFMLGYLLF